MIQGVAAEWSFSYTELFLFEIEFKAYKKGIFQSRNIPFYYIII